MALLHTRALHTRLRHQAAGSRQQAARSIYSRQSSIRYEYIRARARGQGVPSAECRVPRWELELELELIPVILVVYFNFQFQIIKLWICSVCQASFSISKSVFLFGVPSIPRCVLRVACGGVWRRGVWRVACCALREWVGGVGSACRG